VLLLWLLLLMLLQLLLMVLVPMLHLSPLLVKRYLLFLLPPIPTSSSQTPTSALSD
jgi:hypothetical protein